MFSLAFKKQASQKLEYHSFFMFDVHLSCVHTNYPTTMINHLQEKLNVGCIMYIHCDATCSHVMAE